MIIKTGDKGTAAGNAVVSMRNPPIVFVPDKCIRQLTDLSRLLRKRFCFLTKYQKKKAPGKA